MQQRLKALGYNVSVDGNFGPGTFCALAPHPRRRPHDRRSLFRRSHVFRPNFRQSREAGRHRAAPAVFLVLDVPPQTLAIVRMAGHGVGKVPLRVESHGAGKLAPAHARA